MKKKRVPYIVFGVILLAAGIFFGVKSFLGNYAPEAELSESYAPATPSPTPVSASTPTPAPTPTASATPTASPSPTPYVSPIDFDGLRSVNSDIYAWIEIDNTNISYPVAQSGDDDTFYLNHNTDGSYSANGSIYSESAYNSKSMTDDPVVVLYGHHMKSGAMFGYLQQYFTDSEFFEENSIIRVYTPDATLEYGVFAAVPYSNEHILYTHDFSDESVFSSFFEGIFNIRDLEAQFREEYAPEPGDHVLILSTCLASNNQNRFLVMATLLD